MTFLNAYHNRQKILGNLNGITKANLAKLPEMKEWLEVDADARKEFGKMRIFTEATIVTENHDDKWASTGKAWQTQHRVY
jgi:hypothetical protein